MRFSCSRLSCINASYMHNLGLDVLDFATVLLPSAFPQQVSQACSSFPSSTSNSHPCHITAWSLYGSLLQQNIKSCCIGAIMILRTQLIKGPPKAAIHITVLSRLSENSNSDFCYRVFVFCAGLLPIQPPRGLIPNPEKQGYSIHNGRYWKVFLHMKISNSVGLQLW